MPYIDTTCSVELEMAPTYKVSESGNSRKDLRFKFEVTPSDFKVLDHLSLPQSQRNTCHSFAFVCLMAARTAEIARNTNETQIQVSIDLDCQPGTGKTQEISISTGIGFLDHVSFYALE